IQTLGKDEEKVKLNFYRKGGRLVYDFKNETKRIYLDRLLPGGFFLPENLPLKERIGFNREFGFGRIHYVGADRLGPQDFYYKSTLAKFPNVGSKGELTASVLQKKKNDSINPGLCIGSGQNVSMPSVEILEAQTEAWLSYIFDGGKVEIR